VRQYTNLGYKHRGSREMARYSADMPRFGLLAIVLLCASPALAAPTCQDRNGTTIRCGEPGAMLPGWTLPPDEFNKRQAELHNSNKADTILDAVVVIALFLVGIALLPEFDGRRNEDWEG
jgi:hypothetical protein